MFNWKWQWTTSIHLEEYTKTSTCFSLRYENQLLLERQHQKSTSFSLPLWRLLSTIMYFFAASRNEDWKHHSQRNPLWSKLIPFSSPKLTSDTKNPTKRIRPRHLLKMSSKLDPQLWEDLPLYHDALQISIKTPSFYWHDTFLVDKDDDIEFKGLSLSATNNFESEPRDCRWRDIFLQ